MKKKERVLERDELFQARLYYHLSQLKEQSSRVVGRMFEILVRVNLPAEILIKAAKAYYRNFKHPKAAAA